VTRSNPLPFPPGLASIMAVMALGLLAGCTTPPASGPYLQVAGTENGIGGTGQRPPSSVDRPDDGLTGPNSLPIEPPAPAGNIGITNLPGPEAPPVMPPDVAEPPEPSPQLPEPQPEPPGSDSISHPH